MAGLFTAEITWTGLSRSLFASFISHKLTRPDEIGNFTEIKFVSLRFVHFIMYKLNRQTHYGFSIF